MGIGKFNIKLGFFAVLGYVFVLIGAGQSLILLAGFMIVAEKSRKAIIQVVQAVGIYVLNSVMVLLISSMLVGMANTMNSLGLYEVSLRLSDLVLKANGIVGGMAWAAAIAGSVFILIGKPFEVPFVDKIFGDADTEKVMTEEEKTVEV